MIILPPLKDYTQKRPGKSGFEESCLIPSKEHSDFWDIVYRSLFACNLSFPVLEKEKAIHPAYGYFGERMHPATLEPNYYHQGLEFDLKKNDEVSSAFSGVLEYSGFNIINGHYVLLSHPHIQTEDGYVLHSMYCHLKKSYLKFNSYQKMLREISLGSYPEIPVEKKQNIGMAGTSGLTQDGSPRLYFQLDFRKLDKPPIAVDPYQIIRGAKIENISFGVNSKDEFLEILKKHK